jgi:hypothetical protein
MLVWESSARGLYRIGTGRDVEQQRRVVLQTPAQLKTVAQMLPNIVGGSGTRESSPVLYTAERPDADTTKFAVLDFAAIHTFGPAHDLRLELLSEMLVWESAWF